MSTTTGYQDQFQAGTMRTNPWTFSAMVGFFAGLFWGLVKLVFYWFEFTKIRPSQFVTPWYKAGYLNSWQGHFIGYFWIVVASIAAALLYALVLRKVKGPWPGMAYGLLWWAVMYIWIGPWTGLTEPVLKLDPATFWSEICLYLLWGTFIGYSISFEFTDEQSRDSNMQVLK